MSNMNIINPRRACAARVTVVVSYVVCVCVRACVRACVRVCVFVVFCHSVHLDPEI